AADPRGAGRGKGGRGAASRPAEFPAVAVAVRNDVPVRRRIGIWVWTIRWIAVVIGVAVAPERASVGISTVKTRGAIEEREVDKRRVRAIPEKAAKWCDDDRPSRDDPAADTD